MEYGCVPAEDDEAAVRLGGPEGWVRLWNGRIRTKAISTAARRWLLYRGSCGGYDGGSARGHLFHDEPEKSWRTGREFRRVERGEGVADAEP